MKVCIMQPHFLPFTGYFELIKHADIFVFYDSAQFVRGSWHSRTPIVEDQIVKWLTVPVENKGNFQMPIHQIRIQQSYLWKSKMCKRLLANYYRLGDQQFLVDILDILSEDHVYISDLNIQMILYITKYLGLRSRFARTSDIALVSTDRRDKILEICQRFNATTYICSPGSRFYIEESFFKDHGIALHWVDYHYSYQAYDIHRKSMYPSILDVVMRKGQNFVLKEIEKMPWSE